MHTFRRPGPRAAAAAAGLAILATVLGAGAPSPSGPVADAARGGGVPPPIGGDGASCPADVNADGVVNVFDLLDVLAAWGNSGGPEDINGDGIVNVFDLLEVLAAWGDCPSGDPTALDLAGSRLGAYPFFSFVRAFNAGSTVEVAIDPADLGAGGPCDVYIVEARTAAQWQADPSLTDVRGAPQAATFGGATIQANTFALTGSETLNASAVLGVGYDVVCDFNANGTLDGGDVIDGLADEAGFYVVHDLTNFGPHVPPVSLQYTVAPGSVTPGFEPEEVFYPAGIASMGQLPLVLVGHGNGHDYRWYDHIGDHLSTYGYVVMSYRNNTGPGIDSAARTTLEHTDAFLDQLGTIAGGVLQGHVDTSRIIWVGHSRGGEGVVRAYDRIFAGGWTPQNYTLDDIILLVSICPTYFSPGVSSADPHEKSFHLFYTGADADVTGRPTSTSSKPFAIMERARGIRHLNYLHGAGHGDFHNGTGSSVATGPDLIGRPATHKVLLSYLLILAERYAGANIPALDYLQRMYGDIHPLGIAPNVIVAKEYKDADSTGNFMVDGYESQSSLSVSSSGGPVTFSVANVAEGRMVDLDGSFDSSAGVPFNGMTKARFAFDDSSCAVFDWPPAGTRFYELGIVAGQRDLSDDAFLSFRACQGTRHPETDALNAPMSFTVTLRDTGGTTSAIDFGAYGGTITRTYLRTGSGSGAGWANEYSTVRIRLRDFLHNGSGLDLADVAAVRFDFGAGFGSPRGRIGLDDVEVTSQ